MTYAVLGDADRSEIECSAAAKMAEMGLRLVRMNWPPSKHEGNRHERRRDEAKQRRAARRAR